LAAIAAPLVSSHRKRGEEFSKIVDQSGIIFPPVVYACIVHAGATGTPTTTVVEGQIAVAPFAPFAVQIIVLAPPDNGPSIPTWNVAQV